MSRATIFLERKIIVHVLQESKMCVGNSFLLTVLNARKYPTFSVVPSYKCIQISILLGMHNIIGSESADNGFGCKYRHWTDMKNYANMSCQKED